MGQPFPTQHPAVVLRSHFKLVRGLLAVAMAAIVALSAAVVIVANDDNEIAGRVAQPAELPALPNSAVHSHPLGNNAGTRYDGGPEEGLAGRIASSPTAAPVARYDGGPNEGTRAIATPAPAPAPERTSDAGSGETDAPVTIPQGPGGPR